MEPHQPQEWHHLESRTCCHLRRRQHILRSKHRPILQYLVMPSFAKTWCLDIVRTGPTLAGYFTVWRSSTDINAFTTAIERLKHPQPFVPTIESTPLGASNDTLETMLAKLEHIKIPLSAIRNSISLDGTRFELQIGDGWSGVLLKWSNCVPDEWPVELHYTVSELDAMERQLAAQASEQADEPEPFGRCDFS